MVESGEINNPLRNSIHDYGFLYHPYAQICMGNCPMCRDAKKDQKYIRKARKAEFKEQIKEELKKESDLIDDDESDPENI
jgi:hypothetical protein